MHQRTNVVFFGSGPVAAQSLAFLSEHFSIEAIITKPATRDEMQAICPDSTVEIVSNRAELDALVSTRKFSSACAVLIDFGIIVSQAVIDSFSLGIINSHFSLLPEWRGADPITFAILSGQQTTGVSLMLLVAAMDEGPLIGQASCLIPARATTSSLTTELIALSNSLLVDILPQYLAGKVQPRPQEAASLSRIIRPTYSRKLTKEDGIVDWQKPATQLEREIRAFSTWPKSHAVLAGREIIITEAFVEQRSGQSGEILATAHELLVCCGEQALGITRLKPAGKPEMTAQAFLAGYRRFLS